MQKEISIGHIFSEHGQEYIQKHGITGQQKGIINLLSSCRTAALGSHFQKCNHCSSLELAYNSCRNRHCPTCQQKDKQEWLQKRMKELLPVGYYHLVFTIPHQLNNICQQNKKVMYDILFKAASQTVIELSSDIKHMGANTGLISVLHSWGQNMMEHPHLHCIMPAGGLSFNKEHWVHSKHKKDKHFFVSYRILSAKFKGKYLALLQKAFDNKQIRFNKDIKPYGGSKKFATLINVLYKLKWVVNIQKPFGSPAKVLEYLSRYVFRIAITNKRITQIKDGKVTFTWKDYKTDGVFREMTLDINEFIRRYLLHLLPNGFFKIRYHGIFSNGHRKKNIKLAKLLLKQEQELDIEQQIEDTGKAMQSHDEIWNNLMQMVLAYKPNNCKKCNKGRMVFAGIADGKITSSA